MSERSLAIARMLSWRLVRRMWHRNMQRTRRVSGTKVLTTISEEESCEGRQNGSSV